MKSETIDVKEAAALLGRARDVLIITHKNPDGDTLGCGCALCAALRTMGTRARVANDDEINARYDYMFVPLRSEDEDFEPLFIVAADIAAAGLMGASFEKYADRVDLCIDHHGTNERYARRLLLDPGAASCAEVVYPLLGEMGVELTPYLADCLYTGLSTDTGCFRYANTTASSHRLASRLFEAGCDYINLNRVLFETKTRGRMRLEQLALAGLEFALGGRVAFITVTQDMLDRSGCDGSDVEGLTALSRTIEGVEAGVTLREQKDGNWKVSMRTVSIDAARICEHFGGGGHPRAAGFECSGTAYDVKCIMCEAVEGMLGA